MAKAYTARRTTCPYAGLNIQFPLIINADPDFIVKISPHQSTQNLQASEQPD